MSRYIDAEKLMAEFDKCLWGKEWDKALARVCVANTPTADVQEVRHGKWEDTGDGYLCSECGMFLDTYLWVTRHYDIFHNGFNYCPDCGARMDK